MKPESEAKMKYGVWGLIVGRYTEVGENGALAPEPPRRAHPAFHATRREGAGHEEDPQSGVRGDAIPRTRGSLCGLSESHGC